jgi:hypothetical protein
MKKESITIPETIRKWNMRQNLNEDEKQALSVLLEKEPTLIEQQEIENYLIK